ncbi:deaminase [Kurthia gibsonii]|uniref:deaminase n=1 Tax=Kurthia gibsonii TaxID=33946 RepID=UPI002DB5D365|nr:deaminase [Kurthia gibsonii]MEB6113541.1 deaminase [Kurthia gibsonii]
MTKEQWMQKTIELAYENTVNGGKPFGAIIVKNDDIVAVGVNEVLETHDPTAHAERQAETNDAFALWIEKQQ